MLLVYAETGKPCIGYIECVWFILGFDIANSCSHSSCCIKGDQKREEGTTDWIQIYVNSF